MHRATTQSMVLDTMLRAHVFLKSPKTRPLKSPLTCFSTRIRSITLLPEYSLNVAYKYVSKDM